MHTTARNVKLTNWTQEPRPYQAQAIETAVQHVGQHVMRTRLNLEGVPAGRDSLLLASPTGTGKGTIELGLLRTLRLRGEDAVIVTPSLEVIRGYLERCGATAEDLQGSAEELARLGDAIHVTTPVRLRNRLRDGRRTAPSVVIVDEAHHSVESNLAGGGLRALTPSAAWVGFTATPYRGSPEETKDLRDSWGEPTTVLTIPQAVACGAWALPTWRVEGLVNDDACTLRNGDLDADEAVFEQVGPLAKLIEGLDLSTPTCVTLPSVRAASSLAKVLEDAGVECRVVLGETPTEERAEAFTRCAQGGCLLVSVKVLGEGVDLPWLRRWVDASPTLSPWRSSRSWAGSPARVRSRRSTWGPTATWSVTGTSSRVPSPGT